MCFYINKAKQMRLINSIDDSKVPYEDLPVWGTSGYIEPQSEPPIRKLQNRGIRQSQQVDENTFVMRRYGLRSVKNPVRMVVRQNGFVRPKIEEFGLTKKFEWAYLWRDLNNAENFSKAFERKHGVKLEPFEVNSTHVISDVVMDT